VPDVRVMHRHALYSTGQHACGCSTLLTLNPLHSPGGSYAGLLAAWGQSEVLGRLDAMRMLMQQPDRCTIAVVPDAVHLHSTAVHGAARPSSTMCRSAATSDNTTAVCLPSCSCSQTADSGRSSVLYILLPRLQAVGAVPHGGGPRAASAAVRSRRCVVNAPGCFTPTHRCLNALADTLQ
jgi:hypothetical protein